MAVIAPKPTKEEEVRKGVEEGRILPPAGRPTIAPAPPPAPSSPDEGAEGPAVGLGARSEAFRESVAREQERKAREEERINAGDEAGDVPVGTIKDRRIFEESAARGTALKQVEAVKGAKQQEGYDLAKAIRGGVPLKTLKEAGFSEKEVNQASARAKGLAPGEGVRAPERVPVRTKPVEEKPPEPRRFRPDVPATGSLIDAWNALLRKHVPDQGKSQVVVAAPAAVQPFSDTETSLAEAILARMQDGIAPTPREEALVDGYLAQDLPGARLAAVNPMSHTRIAQAQALDQKAKDGLPLTEAEARALNQYYASVRTDVGAEEALMAVLPVGKLFGWIARGAKRVAIQEASLQGLQKVAARGASEATLSKAAADITIQVGKFGPNAPQRQVTGWIRAYSDTVGRIPAGGAPLPGEKLSEAAARRLLQQGARRTTTKPRPEIETFPTRPEVFPTRPIPPGPRPRVMPPRPGETPRIPEPFVRTRPGERPVPRQPLRPRTPEPLKITPPRPRQAPGTPPVSPIPERDLPDRIFEQEVDLPVIERGERIISRPDELPRNRPDIGEGPGPGPDIGRRPGDFTRFEEAQRIGPKGLPDILTTPDTEDQQEPTKVTTKEGTKVGQDVDTGTREGTRFTPRRFPERGRPPRPPGRPIAPRLPSGESLDRGEYIRAVEWPQGGSIIRKDVVTGRTTFRRNPGDPTQSPMDGFQVVSKSQVKPRRQSLDLGVVDVIISPTTLRFVRSQDATLATPRSRPALRRPPGALA